MRKSTSEKYQLEAIKRHNRYTRLVRIALMRICAPAQRVLKPHWVEEIYADFNPDMFGTPEVSFRDGVYYIVDGQHRIEAAKKYLGEWEDQQVECGVWEGLTEKDEALLFRALNHKLHVDVFDNFRIGVHGEVSVESSIARIVDSIGYNISKKRGENTIACVGSLMKVYNRDGEDTLSRDLLIIRDTYGTAGFDANMIDGFGKLCQRYNGSLNDKDVTKSLSKVHGGLNGLLNQADIIRKSTNKGKAECIAAAVTEILNRDRARNKKLPPWFKAVPPKKKLPEQQEGLA